MYTPEVAVMDMDRGLLARIDRKLLAGLGGDEAYRTVRVPTGTAKWSTWRRYCESVGISMGRAVTLLIDRELISVFGEHIGDAPPVFAQRATEQLRIREANIAAREREVDAEQERMRGWGERLRRWEDELDARERRAALVSKLPPRDSTIRAKIGRNERCPCGSGRKCKHCHGSTGSRTYCRIWAVKISLLALLGPLRWLHAARWREPTGRRTTERVAEPGDSDHVQSD